MDRLKALGRGTQLMFVASVLLLIVSFFNWQEVDFDLGPLGEGSAGVSAWDNFLGIVMGILTIVLIARIAARMAAVDVPIPVSFAMTSVVFGVLIAIAAVLKNLTDDYSTFWSYIGAGLAILIAIGAWLEVQDAGGVDSLKAEASSYGSAGGAAADAPAATPEAATAAAAPGPAPDPPATPVTEATPAATDAAAAADDVTDASDAVAEPADDVPPENRT
jgi:hypothetical protein